MKQFFRLMNNRQRLGVALSGVVIVTLLIINPFHDPSKPTITESGLVKATAINPSNIPKRGIPAPELAKYKAAHEQTKQQTPQSSKTTVSNTQDQQPEYTQADDVQAPQAIEPEPIPFDEKPAVVAAKYYAPAKMPASLAAIYPPSGAPRPVPIEKVIEQRQRLAKGEVLHTVGVIKQPPLMPKTKADVEKMATEQQKFQGWWQVNNGAVN